MNNKTNQNTEGFVYFITNGFNIKIGYTNNVKRRLKQLNTGSDQQLFLLGYINGTKETEANLHRFFIKYKLRQNGEWFEPSSELLDYINTNNLIPNIFVEKNELWDNRVMAFSTT